MEGVGPPLAMDAHRTKRLQDDSSGLELDCPGCLVEMNLPVDLPHWIGWQHGAAGKGMLRIDPTLFRARQMCSIGGEYQEVGQNRHTKPVPDLVRNSQPSNLGRLRFRLGFSSITD